MARGWPDYGNVSGVSQEGEFLRSLTSAPVWFSDIFDTPMLKWGQVWGTIVLINDPAAGAIDSRATLSDAIMRITPIATTYGQARRYFGPPPKTSFTGIEVYFSLTDLRTRYADRADSINIRLGLDDGFNAYTIGWSYNPRDDLWYITLNGTTWVTNVYKGRLATARRHRVKLIVDFQNLQYRTLIVDGYSIDLTAYNFVRTGATPLIGSSVLLTTWDVVASLGVLYIDGVFITHGES